MSSPVFPSASLSAGSPRVSVVIPLFNCLALTQAMLASLHATLPRSLSHEIIFVDDGSTDGTRAWLASLGAGYHVILNERNLGYAAANNRGAAIARGETLVLLNNDLVLTRGWLEPMLDARRELGTRAGIVGNIQRDARTAAIDHVGIFFNHKGKPEHDRSPPPFWSRLVKPIRRAEAVTGACLLVDRALWTELGGFDEGYANGCEDVDLCLRAQRAGRLNVVALRSTVFHHISASPGRKRRDEENTFRFTRLWRSALVHRAVRQWCWNYFETCSLHPRDEEFVLATRICLHALGITRRPPAEALRRTDAAIGAELARWEALLGKR